MPLYRKWYPDSNFCKACEQEKEINDMGYCQQCDEELENFRAHPSWHKAQITLECGAIVVDGQITFPRGMYLAYDPWGIKPRFLALFADEFHGEIDVGPLAG